MKPEKQHSTIKVKEEYNIKVISLSFLGLLFFMHALFAQDSIPQKLDLNEEADLKFQEFFFKALSEKAIGNYKKAISNLESCNQILPNDEAVYFEFSKNYLALNNTLLARDYIDRALEKEPENIWMLKHLVKIYQRENNLDKAIQIQRTITQNHPKERTYLIQLLVYNRNYEEALALMKIVEQEDGLSANLKKLRQQLLGSKTREKPKPLSDISSLEKAFKTNKSFEILEKLLRLSEGNPKKLLKLSEEGMLLFPAQPLVYLMNGKANNESKNYKKALVVLRNGIDFVITADMEVTFLIEIANAYKGLGNDEEAQKYVTKAKKIKS